MGGGRGLGLVSGCLGRFGLASVLSGEMCRLDNKRRRQVTVVGLVLRKDQVVLTSRPASKLSERGRSVIVGLLGRLGRGNVAVVVIARGVGLLSYFSEIVGMRGFE